MEQDKKPKYVVIGAGSSGINHVIEAEKAIKMAESLGHNIIAIDSDEAVKLLNSNLDNTTMLTSNPLMEFPFKKRPLVDTRFDEPPIDGKTNRKNNRKKKSKRKKRY